MATANSPQAIRELESLVLQSLVAHGPQFSAASLQAISKDLVNLLPPAFLGTLFAHRLSRSARDRLALLRATDQPCPPLADIVQELGEDMLDMIGAALDEAEDRLRDEELLAEFLAPEDEAGPMRPLGKGVRQP